MAKDYSALVKQLSESPEALEIMRRTQQQKRQAQAASSGEAQRRGFVNPTGTSDIEFAMRSAATRPIEEAGAGAYANLIGRGVEAERGREFQTSERQGRQAYGTSEREAGQRYGTGEREARQVYGTGEREAGQRYGTSERVGRQQYGTSEREGAQRFSGEMAGYIDPNTGKQIAYTDPTGKQFYGARGDAERGYQHEFGMASFRPRGPKKKKWYETAGEQLLGGVASGAGQAVGGAAASYIPGV